jgi:hypothetical protein
MATKHFKEKLQKNAETKQVEEKNVLADNPKIEKDIRDGKPHKDTKDHKEGKDLKDAKEHSKHEHKEHNIETLQPLRAEESTPMPGAASPAYAAGQNPIFPKALKEVHKEFKEFINEKIVAKEYIKEHLKEFQKESFKEFFEHKYIEVPIGDPGGPVEQRVQALEASISQLSHFISQELRPDLSQGALKRESNVAAKKAAPKKAAKKSAKSAS